jgi:FAD/FMN-containing dehydrogenase
MLVQQLDFSTPQDLLPFLERLRGGPEKGPDHFCAQLTHEATFALLVTSDAPQGNLRYAPPATVETPPHGELDPRRHLWCDYAFCSEAAAEFIRRSVEELRDPFLRQYLDRIYVLCLRRPSDDGGLFDIRRLETDDPNVFGVGLYFNLYDEDRAGLVRIKSLWESLLSLALALGGRPYLQGSHPPDADSMAILYPAQLARLEALRRRYDPRHLLNRGALPPWK